MSFTTGELRRDASSRRNAKTEAFRTGEGGKESRIQVEINNVQINKELTQGEALEGAASEKRKA